MAQLTGLEIKGDFNIDLRPRTNTKMTNSSISPNLLHQHILNDHGSCLHKKP